MFVERIESIISADIARMVNSNDKNNKSDGLELQNQTENDTGGQTKESETVKQKQEAGTGK